jgi:hypothetical protein
MDAPVALCTARSTSPKVEFSARILSSPSRKVTCGGLAGVSAGGVPEVWFDPGGCPDAAGNTEAGLDDICPTSAGTKPASKIEAHTSRALILILKVLRTVHPRVAITASPPRETCLLVVILHL